MSSHATVTALNDIWTAAAGAPFYPGVSKSGQFSIGFVLFLIGVCIGVRSV
ncbi:MAG: hypothetical protein INR71_14725 [Terriglobus roseus]|nr:hypothetical protein [Terriglobus roseus]